MLLQAAVVVEAAAGLGPLEGVVDVGECVCDPVLATVPDQVDGFVTEFLTGPGIHRRRVRGKFDPARCDVPVAIRLWTGLTSRNPSSSRTLVPHQSHFEARDFAMD